MCPQRWTKKNAAPITVRAELHRVPHATPWNARTAIAGSYDAAPINVIPEKSLFAASAGINFLSSCLRKSKRKLSGMTLLEL